MATGRSVERLDHLRGRTEDMVEHLDALVSVETFSEDVDACATGARTVADLIEELVGPPTVLTIDGRPHVRATGPDEAGAPRILLLGHFDTVFPTGTLADRPFAVDRATGTITGPGCFDMKAGIVQLLHAVATLDSWAGLDILLTSDEEIGSGTSRALIEEAAAQAVATLVFEPSLDGAVKTGRKGTGTFELAVQGRAAHAGLEPEKGANALAALARVLLDLEPIARPEIGTTVTPTVARSGSATNTVPDHAHLAVDVRVAVLDEAPRVTAAIRSLTTGVDGTTLTVTGQVGRPPMPESSSTELFARAVAAADRLGIGPLDGAVVGGGSDGNFTAAVGCPTLDGLGAVGAGAHTADEHVVLAAMPERAALLAELLDDLRAG
jgi:glutamate carboxypeptidase